MDPLLQHIGESVDRLVTIDVLGYGVIGPLYGAARERQEPPLCLSAARALADRVGPGACAMITTGWILPGHAPYGETDGPVGAAVLARALALGLQAKVLLVTEADLVGMVAATCRAAELQVVSPDLFRQDPGTHRPVAAVVPLASQPDRAAAETTASFRDYGPQALIAIEKSGPNGKGVYHMVGGQDVSEGVAKAGLLFAEARRLGVLTIGIGDRGNEIGFGRIHDVVQALLPYGARCRCPCGGGVADQTTVDVVIPAEVSNWGAYGIAACLAALQNDPDLLHTPEMERALIRTAVQHGGVDGMSGRARLAVDGIDIEVNAGLVALLGEIIRAQSARRPSAFSTPILRAGGDAREGAKEAPRGAGT
ncbi:MAG: DUF4392 domain-containing protein [candidate division NC10 bacterium]|nr:DUF4392 domain-containing protein [candidate division NC10 bacterium]